MSGLERIGMWLVVGGVAMAVLGGLFWLLGRVFPNLGSFPGTIRIQGGGFTCVFPLLASIVISILLTVVLNVIARFLNK